MQELLDNEALINDMLARYGVRFGIYKNGNFKEQLDVLVRERRFLWFQV